MQYTAETIANWFLSRSRQDGEFLTHMKLQKLVYISHGWSLGAEAGGLLAEPVEAWEYGPVIRSLYNKYKVFRGAPIVDELGAAAVTLQDASLLEWVWQQYHKFTAVQLSGLTHKSDTPWTKSYQPGVNVVIPTETIHDHYRDKLAAIKAGTSTVAP